MRKSIILFVAIFLSLQSNAQFNLGSLIEKVTDAKSDSTSTESKIGNILGNLVATDKIELNQLVGSWNYSSPAVSFKSDNVLKKIGGSAASATVEDELKAYYEKAGLTNLCLTVDESANFTMKAKYATLQGVIEKGDDVNFIFNFSAFGKIKIGQLTAYTTLSGSTLSLTFDIKKLVSIMKKVSELSNNSTIKGAMSLLDSYEGINAGFKLKKQK